MTRLDANHDQNCHPAIRAGHEGLMGQVPDTDERKRFESLYEDSRLQVLA